MRARVSMIVRCVSGAFGQVSGFKGVGELSASSQAHRLAIQFRGVKHGAREAGPMS